MIERRLVGPRRLVEARELSHELERGSPDLLVGRGRVEVKQSLDVSAHSISPGSGFMASLDSGHAPRESRFFGMETLAPPCTTRGRRDLNPAAGSLGTTPICL